LGKEIVWEGAIMDYDLAHLFDDDLKDPRIAGKLAALVTLDCARYYPQ
jgi:hypothetical protein